MSPATVETVRGPVDVRALGRTLMHEHIFVLDPAMLGAYGTAWGESYWNEDREIAHAVQQLRRLKDAGFDTLVDPTVPGVGRHVPLIARVNAQVDLNIVVATGHFAFVELPLFLRLRSPERIAELFVRDIREGVDGTGVKAAFLKFAVEELGLVGDVPLIVKAIALAHHETGVPIMVHTNAAARTGPLALGALQAEGVDPRRVVIAHAGDSDDLGYLRAIADAGAALGCDRLPGEHIIPLQARLRTLVALIGEGYADRIHLSHDGACFLDFYAGDPDVAAMGLEGDYLFIHHTVVPALLQAGVTQAQIDEILVRNPQRFFDSEVPA
jgi:phosphotriesterase-related protein